MVLHFPCSTFIRTHQQMNLIKVRRVIFWRHATRQSA
jgi:hypothetical protein